MATEDSGGGGRKYGVMPGVFTPTLLTILGVIMFLRLPWVVGNAGLGGALAIIGISVAITLATGLSLSSIATNTRLGAGGPYAVISRSLGLEVGGSIAVPLYLSQALAVSMYIFGFREGWLWIFPEHDPLLVDLGVFGVIFAIAFVSAGLAFKIQYLVMAVIFAGIVSVVAGVSTWESIEPVSWSGEYPGAPESEFAGMTFWQVFAVFFPAATGIMAGANMSGELSNPRRAIPLGTLSAIVISAVIYVGLAYWSAIAAPVDELVSNYTVMVDRALWAPLVLAGLLGATFSSALSSMVGAPRILMALGADRLLPGSTWVAKKSKNGEPRQALMVTGVIVVAALMLRTLNAIAPLITMFFLIAYAVINLVMLLESSLGLMSFRPSLRIPRAIPLVGGLGCIFAMFIVNPTFSLVAAGIVIAIYFYMLRADLPGGDDVRSGAFVSLAEWAATRIIEYDIEARRAWKPSFLLPFRDAAELRGEFELITEFCKPEGNIKLLGIADESDTATMREQAREIGHRMRDSGVFTTWAVVDAADFVTGVIAGAQTLDSAIFRPNILMLRLPSDDAQARELQSVIDTALRLQIGVVLLALHENAGVGLRQVVNLWVRPPRDDSTIAQALEKGNMNLGIISAIRLAAAWKAQLNVITVVPDEDSQLHAHAWITELRDLARIPRSATTRVIVGSIEEAVAVVPQSDMDIMGFSKTDMDLQQVRRMVELTSSSCMFVRDSGRESVLA